MLNKERKFDIPCSLFLVRYFFLCFHAKAQRERKGAKQKPQNSLRLLYFNLAPLRENKEKNIEQGTRNIEFPFLVQHSLFLVRYSSPLLRYLSCSCSQRNIPLQHLISICNFPSRVEDHSNTFFIQVPIYLFDRVCWFVVIRFQHTVVEK